MRPRTVNAISRSVTIAAKIANIAGRQHKFQEGSTFLDAKKITGFRVHSEALTKSFDGDDVVTNTIIKKSFLTLVDETGELRLQKIPLESFFNSNGVIEDVFLDMKVDIRKSFIDLPDSTGAVVNTVYLITFFFE